MFSWSNAVKLELDYTINLTIFAHERWFNCK